MPEFITAANAAKATGISNQVIRRWCRVGAIRGAHKNDNDEWVMTVQALRRCIEADDYKVNELTIKEAALIADVSEGCIRKWCVYGWVKASKPRKTWKINRQSLMDFAVPPEGYLTFPEVAEKYHYSNAGITYLAREGIVKSVEGWHGRHLYCEEDIVKHINRERHRVQGTKQDQAREWFIDYYKGRIPDMVPGHVTRACAAEFGIHPDTAAQALACARRELGLSIPSKVKPLKAWLLEHTYIWLPNAKIYEQIEQEFTKFKVSRSVIDRVITELRNEVRRTEYEVIEVKNYDHWSKKQQYEKNRL